MCSFGQDVSACISPSAYSAASLSWSPGKLRLAQSNPSISENAFDFDIWDICFIDSTKYPASKSAKLLFCPFTSEASARAMRWFASSSPAAVFLLEYTAARRSVSMRVRRGLPESSSFIVLPARLATSYLGSGLFHEFLSAPQGSDVSLPME